MLFNSAVFFVFIVPVYSIYLLLRRHLRLQNRFLLAASCLFYGWWDWRFLLLMAFTIVVDFCAGRAVAQTHDPGRKKRYLTASVISNLTVLGFFKYFNFFSSSGARLLDVLGFHSSPVFVDIILPVGISFYTFQSMSYVIDVYRGHLKPVRNILDYALYVSYFPQLVAGPIERGTHLLPQMLKTRHIVPEQVCQGFYLIFWGLFQKVFVADNLARLVDPVFAADTPVSGLSVLLALYAYAFQIFCDFAGYSNIARGLGKLMGFDIMVNFNLPYFAAGAREFWRRWHISLSTWLRDYLYIPLGGNRQGRKILIRNLALTMILGGLWHGAAWNFVLWGVWHALLLIIQRETAGQIPSVPGRAARCLKTISFFHLVCFGWLLFRAESIPQILTMLQSLFLHFEAGPEHLIMLQKLIFYTTPLLLVQCLQFFRNDLLAVLKLPVPARAIFYLICFYLLVFFGAAGGKEFIYFQF